MRRPALKLRSRASLASRSAAYLDRTWGDEMGGSCACISAVTANETAANDLILFRISMLIPTCQSEWHSRQRQTQLLLSGADEHCLLHLESICGYEYTMRVIRKKLGRLLSGP
jgi:hypothetical protein